MFPSGNSGGGGGGGGGDHSAIFHTYAEQYFFSPEQYYHNLLPHHHADGDGESATPSLVPHPCAPSPNPRAMAEADPTGFGHNVVSGNSTKPGRFPGKKRSGKKDRHSKICTARGPRDRRMRLSLDIARAFFDLQDLLGFDKASKTVGWLLDKSKAAIKDLKRSSTAAAKAKSSKTSITTTSSTSEGEATSGVDETNADDNNNIIDAEPPKPPPSSFSNPKAKKATKASRKYSTFDPHAKESRAMARARARARTKEKLWERRLEVKSPESPVLRESKSLEVEEPRSQLPESGRAFDYHHLGVNTDSPLSLQNNDVINFFRQNWGINIPETQLPTNNGDHHVHERLVFGSPADIRHHLPHHFAEAHQHLLVKPWEGY